MSDFLGELLVHKYWQFLFANIVIGVASRYFDRLAIRHAFFDVKTHQRVLHLAECIGPLLGVIVFL